jgi:hypothetical protein
LSNSHTNTGWQGKKNQEEEEAGSILSFGKLKVT